jgi:hypothetical protein
VFEFNPRRFFISHNDVIGKQIRFDLLPSVFALHFHQNPLVSCFYHHIAYLRHRWDKKLANIGAHESKNQ